MLIPAMWPAAQEWCLQMQMAAEQDVRWYPATETS